MDVCFIIFLGYGIESIKNNISCLKYSTFLNFFMFYLFYSKGVVGAIEAYILFHITQQPYDLHMTIQPPLTFFQARAHIIGKLKINLQKLLCLGTEI